MDGQMTLFEFIKPTISVEKPIRLIELFAGYGSQAMALRNLGADFETYKVVEFDRFAMASYNAVHGTNYDPTDINEVKGSDLEIKDKDKFVYLTTYSFPCTDISVAGRMEGFAEGSGTRSSLLWQVKRILQELNETDDLPQILLMENVTAIHSKANTPHFQKWIQFLEDLGYSNYVTDLNAADFGVAQHRERTFVLSVLGNYNYSFPDTMDLNKCIENYFEELTEEQALQYVVKSEKALELLVRLDEKGELE